MTFSRMVAAAADVSPRLRHMSWCVTAKTSLKIYYFIMTHTIPPTTTNTTITNVGGSTGPSFSDFKNRSLLCTTSSEEHLQSSVFSFHFLQGPSLVFRFYFHRYYIITLIIQYASDPFPQLCVLST